jgi:hypothetical protein
MRPGPDDVVRALSTREGQITAFVTVGLAFYVRHKGRPWLAAVLLAVVLIVIEAMAGHGPVQLLLRWIVFLAVAAALFWAVDRARSLPLFLALSMAGIAVFLLVV